MKRSGAAESIESIYLRDPISNLIEVLNYVIKEDTMYLG
jgi:hypothetical protein